MVRFQGQGQGQGSFSSIAYEENAVAAGSHKTLVSWVLSLTLSSPILSGLVMPCLVLKEGCLGMKGLCSSNCSGLCPRVLLNNTKTLAKTMTMKMTKTVTKTRQDSTFVCVFCSPLCLAGQDKTRQTHQLHKHKKRQDTTRQPQDKTRQQQNIRQHKTTHTWHAGQYKTPLQDYVFHTQPQKTETKQKTSIRYFSK